LVGIIDIFVPSVLSSEEVFRSDMVYIYLAQNWDDIKRTLQKRHKMVCTRFSWIGIRIRGEIKKHGSETCVQKKTDFLDLLAG